MNIELLLNTRKDGQTGQSRRDAEFISTLFTTQSLCSLAQHRATDANQPTTEDRPAADDSRAHTAETPSLDFRQWLAELSQTMASVYIGPVSGKKRRQPAVKGWLVKGAALVIGFALCLSAQATQQLTLAWNPSPSPGIAGYMIHYGTSSSNYTSHVNAGTNVSVVIPGLKEGQTNYFSVTAYDSTGEQSGPSNEIKYFVPGVIVLSPKAKATDPAKLQFPVAPMHWYEVQASTNLTSWTTVYQTSLSSSNGWMQFTDTQGATMPKRFYRLVLH